MENYVIAFRLLNIGLAVFVVTFCVFKLVMMDTDKARTFRIAGLALLAIVVGWTAYDLLYRPFHPRIPLSTVGLIFSSIGLASHSYRPELPRKKVDKNSVEGS